MQTAVRLAILAGVIACGLWATFVLTPDVRAREARFDACGATPAGACLADLAVEIGLQGRPPSPYSSGVTALRVTGRDAAAHALIIRAEELDGKTAEEARRAADARLAAPRLADAVRQGMSPADAYATVPEVRYGDAYIAALDLLGDNPYGGGFAVRPPTAADQAAVAGFSELLVSLAGGLSDGQKEAAQDYAAELYARLGQRDPARQIFLGIERAGDWIGIVSPMLMDAEIGAFALKQCRGLPDCRARVLQRAAMVAASDAEAEAMLREASAIHLGRQAWPDFTKMGEVVDLAVSRKNSQLALALARDLDRLAQTREGVFPSFPHIAAARALLLAGATEPEVRAAEMVWFNGSPAQRDWALRTVRDVLPAVDPGDEKALATCGAIARVAQGAGDNNLWQAALACAGETAIQSRDASKLLDAARLWFAFEAAQP